MADDQGTDQSQPKKRSRSPAYPAISLRDAIERAQQLYDQEGRNPAPVGAAVSHLGYSTTSGTANAVVSAMRKFDLVSYEGTGDDRTVQLTELALDILEDDRPQSPDRARAIARAARAPKIHDELMSRYPNELPSDATLRFQLLREYGFTQTAVDDFIEQFRETLAFADREAGFLEVDEKGSSSPSGDAPDEDLDGDLTGAADASPPTPRGPTGPGKEVVIPMLEVAPVVLSGPFPVSPSQWDYLMSVLAAMKQGLVAEAGEADRERGEDS